MSKSQFNIKISKDLLIKIKKQAMMSGKSLTEHITDLVTKSLSENHFNEPEDNSNNRFKSLEQRLLNIESIVSNREYLSQKFKPFTNSEAVNCTRFMKGVFDKEFENRKFLDKNQAFDDFFNHLVNYVQVDNFPTERLREVMLNEQPDPWTGKELNDLSRDNKCNCPIRKGLIDWTGKFNCPSQQEICDKGEKLLSFI